MTRAKAVLTALTAVGVAWACNDPAEPEVLTVDATGTVVGVLFQDFNGSGQADAGDKPVKGWVVRLEQPAGGVLASATTDTAGVFEFTEIPAGEAVLRVDPSMLGDSLELFGVALDPFLLAKDTTSDLRPGVRFLTYDLAVVRSLPTGRVIFTQGVALNSLAGGRTLHLKGPEGYLRVTDILSFGLQPGDSVRVRGRTALENGQTVLTEGAVFLAGSTGQTPEPVVLSTAAADGASSGGLDAALVEVRDADIVSVTDEDEDGIRVVIDDGSGPVVLRYEALLDQNPALLVPDSTTIERARGLLVPWDDAGDVRWEIRPRTKSDVKLVQPPPPA